MVQNLLGSFILSDGIWIISKKYAILWMVKGILDCRYQRTTYSLIYNFSILIHFGQSETQSSPGCTCTRRSKFLMHSLGLKSRAVNIGNNLYTNQRNVGLKSGAVSSQERVIMARVQYTLKSIVSLIFTM